MKTPYHIYLILFVLVLSSCRGQKLSTKVFCPINDISELNGKYVDVTDGRQGFARFFNIYGNDALDINVMDLNFHSKDSLRVSYVDLHGYKELNLKGKMKKNYFEVYLHKKRLYFPPIFVGKHIDQLRIGKDSIGNLLVYKWEDRFGFLLGLSNASVSEDSISFRSYKTIAENGLYMVEDGGKWGYVDRNNNVVIKPVYDYVQPFKNGVAKVAQNNYWGVIDTLNNVTVPLIYDVIISDDGEVMRACREGKWGLINVRHRVIAPLVYDEIKSFGARLEEVVIARKENKVGFLNKDGLEIVPVEYDEIEYGSWGDTILVSRLNGKYGYVNNKGVLYYPIFDKASRFEECKPGKFTNKDLKIVIDKYAKVKYKDESYLLTESGMLYKYKNRPFTDSNVGIRMNLDVDSGIHIDDLRALEKENLIYKEE